MFAYQLKYCKVHTFWSLGWLSVHSDPEINSNLDNLTEEWIWSIKGEAARVLICLTLLKRDFNTNVTETFKIFRTTFQDINTKIRSR